MNGNEGIAVLLSAYDETGRWRPTVVVRDEHGHVTLNEVEGCDEVEPRMRAERGRRKECASARK